LTSYYYRPTYPDLQIEERGKFTQASYQSGTIYEWGIDGMNEYHIVNKLQEMTMVSNAHKIRNNSDKTVANILIAGFTGQLKGWWDNVLTTQQQTEILEAIQVNELKEPIFDNNNNEPIEDAVSTLIYNITQYFIGDPTYLKDRTAEQLSNLSVAPNETLTYGDLLSITKTRLEICNDIKMGKQIKRDSKTYKKELGDFCTQFGYEPFKLPPSKTEKLQNQKRDKKYYERKQYEKPEYYKSSRKKTRFKTNNFNKPTNKKKTNSNSFTCYNCGKSGHSSRYCKIRKQIKKIDLSEDHKNQLFKIIDSQNHEEESD
ncbi:LOW QUALITY PROTEIN: zf-CCHC domain-containing protein, partial [Cephalotus follicularis]